MRRLPLFLVAALVLPACSGCDEDSLRVLAAASLTEAFTELGEQFEDAHPGTDVTFSFGPSSTLARQVAEGAPADVLAVADASALDAAEGSLRPPEPIAGNVPVLVMQPGNPLDIDGPADLERPDVTFVMCAPEVPCGRLGAAALDALGVEAAPVARQEDVKAVLATVTLGEADAGIVYATDARATGDDVDMLPLGSPNRPPVVAAVQMAVVAGADERAAGEWVTFVLSPEGQAVLRAHGFRRP